MTTPTDLLRDEHRVILRALDLLERASAPASAVVGDDWWAEAIAWLRAFADENHHAKEERSLFPALVKAGVPTEGGPVGVMLDEHARGRALVAAMAHERGAARAAAARAYISLLRAHIDKENDVLFPLADAVVDEPLMATVRREFEALRLEHGAAASVENAAVVVERLAGVLERR